MTATQSLTSPATIEASANEVPQSDPQPITFDVTNDVTKQMNGKQNGNGTDHKNGHKNGHKNAIQFIDKKLATRQTKLGVDEPKRSEHGKRVSAEEYLLVYAEHPDFNYEWNDGILEEKPVSTIAQLRHYLWFLQILFHYLEVNQLAEAAMFEFLVEMQAGDKLVKRKPDLFIVRKDNPKPLHDEDESYNGVCDFCLELLSTSNQANIDRDVKDKKREYALAGIREYVIIDRDNDHMTFYRLTERGSYKKVKPNAQGVVAFETLPGFQFRWNDLFQRPPLRQLVEDPVYNHYILPEYETLKRRAEQETERAEQERLRAEEAEAQARQDRLRAEEAEAQARQDRFARNEAEIKLAEALARLRLLGQEN